MSNVDIPWRSLHIVLGGASAIDLTTPGVASIDEAMSFLNGYGFDWRAKSQQDELSAIRWGALNLIEEVLLDGEAELVVPFEIRKQDDVPTLLVWASSRPRTRALWSCALLRVMHAIAHATPFLSDAYGSQIGAQIADSFRTKIHSLNGELRLGSGPSSVPLVDFRIVGQPTTRGHAIRILAAPSFVARDLCDQLVLRFVVSSPMDALHVIRQLISQHMIAVANVRPGSTLNTFIPTSAIRRAAVLGASKVAGWDGLRDCLNDDTDESGLIEFVCRHKVRAMDLNTKEVIESLEELSTRLPGAEAVAAIARRELERHTRESSFFFPYTIQITDPQTASRLDAEQSMSERDRKGLKKRVLGDLLFTESSEAKRA